MGIARPTAPFNLSPNDSEIGKELFSVEPLAPKTVSNTSNAPGANSTRSRSRTRSLTVENLRSSNRAGNQASAPNVQVEQDAEMNEDNSAPSSAQAQASSLEPMQQDFENEDSMMGHGVIESNVAGGGNNPDPNDVEQAGNFLFFIYFSIVYLEANNS